MKLSMHILLMEIETCMYLQTYYFFPLYVFPLIVTKKSSIHLLWECALKIIVQPFMFVMSRTPHASVLARQNDFMAIDDPIQVETQGPPLPLSSAAGSLNTFALLDPNFRRSFFEGRGASELSSHSPYVSHPREVREIPIEVKDGNDQSGHSGPRPTIEDVTGTTSHGPEIHGPIIIEDEEDEEIRIAPPAHVAGQNDRKDSFSGNSHQGHPRPSAPELDSMTDYGNDIEEEMIQAAIEASKRDVKDAYSNPPLGAPDVCESNPGFCAQVL